MLPSVQSVLPVRARLFVDDIGVPWEECDNECPIRLELHSAVDNVYKVVGIITKPTDE